ncbi:2Fe-2S iron-sulfur cluster-binding protein [Acinetobacter baumannii]
MSPAANCRSGVCGACRTPVVKGRVVHHPEPITPPADGMAYLCCATPICDVVIA